MKTKNICGAIRLCIMALPGLLVSLFYVSPSMGAKTGTITAPSGSNLDMRTLGDTTPVRETLAGIVRAAFQIATALKIGIINLVTRKAIVIPSDQALHATITGLTNRGHFAKDDPTKASGPWSWNGVGESAALTAVMEAVVAARKPSFSGESLTNLLEDELLKDANLVGFEADEQGFLFQIDQSNGQINVRSGTLAAVEAIDAAALQVEDAAFVQSVDTVTGAQFFE